MSMKKFLAAGLTLAILVGCGAGCSSNPFSSSNTEGDADMPNPQFAEAKGPTAVIKTTIGDITVQLYPEEAPKAVENFITHAKDGYYDGIIFHRVINNFMVQGGDPTGTGRGGESIWGESFTDEFSDKLHNFRGALSMANSGSNTNGSQFFIVQCKDPLAESMAENTMFQWTVNQFQWQLNNASESEAMALMEELNGKLGDYQKNGLPEEMLATYQPAIEKYREVGGTPHLDYKHTVFGQVISSMDVVDAMAAVKTDDQDRPLTDVQILSIEVQE